MPVVFCDWRDAPERWMDTDELIQEMDRAIASLPAKLKAVFILREIEGVSNQESAQILNISESAAKVRLHRARLLLRERLAEYVLECV
jgi:RNA polymerase sigma-70 factor (ECF subfamily)